MNKPARLQDGSRPSEIGSQLPLYNGYVRSEAPTDLQPVPTSLAPEFWEEWTTSNIRTEPTMKSPRANVTSRPVNARPWYVSAAEAAPFSWSQLDTAADPNSALYTPRFRPQAGLCACIRTFPIIASLEKHHLGDWLTLIKAAYLTTAKVAWSILRFCSKKHQ